MHFTRVEHIDPVATASMKQAFESSEKWASSALVATPAWLSATSFAISSLVGSRS